MALDSQTMTLVASTAQTADWAYWADAIIVENEASAVAYVRTDGTVAVVGAAGTTAVPAGASVLVPNSQPRLNGLQYAGSGGLDESPQKSGVGITSQTTPGALWTTGFPTWISVISTGTGNVMVVPQ